MKITLITKVIISKFYTFECFFAFFLSILDEKHVFFDEKCIYYFQNKKTLSENQLFTIFAHELTYHLDLFLVYIYNHSYEGPLSRAHSATACFKCRTHLV